MTIRFHFAVMLQKRIDVSTVIYTGKCEGEANKPELILFYNKNMDQMFSYFTTKRTTKWWNYAFFCNMLDITELAAYCICKEVDDNKRNYARCNFLLILLRKDLV